MADALLHRIDVGVGIVDAGQLPAYDTEARNACVAKPDRPAIELTLVSDLKSFEAMEAEWIALLARSVQPWQAFQTFNWNWHWTRHYLGTAKRRGPKLAIVAGRIGGRLALILPLVTSRVAGLVQLSWMGEPVSQYGDAIAATEAANQATLDRALAFAVAETRADVANLRKVRADALVAPLLAARGSAITATEEAPYMSLSTAPDFETYETRHPPKRRKNRRRQQLRLEERGSIVFEKLSGTDDAGLLAAFAVRLKRASLSGKGLVAPALADQRFADFFADVTHGRGRPTGCSVMTLRSGGEVAGMQLVIDQGAHRFLHVAVFVGKFEKCGAGGLLLERAAIDCFASGISTFDLLCPKHEYKLDFADGTVLVQDHALGLSTLGRTYVRSILGMRSGVKQAIERLPAPARRVIGDAIALIGRRA